MYDYYKDCTGNEIFVFVFSIMALFLVMLAMTVPEMKIVVDKIDRGIIDTTMAIDFSINGFDVQQSVLEDLQNNDTEILTAQQIEMPSFLTKMGMITVCPPWVVTILTALFIIIGKYMMQHDRMKKISKFVHYLRILGLLIYFGIAFWVGMLVFNDGVGLESINGDEISATTTEILSSGTKIVDDSVDNSVNWLYGFMVNGIGESELYYFPAFFSLVALMMITGMSGLLRIAFSVVLGGCVTGLILLAFGFDVLDMHTWYHLATGGLAVGSFFMVVSPVTANKTIRGKWIYGFLIGFSAIMVRFKNPELPKEMIVLIVFLVPIIPLFDYVLLKINGKLRRQHNALIIENEKSDDDE